MCTTVPQYNRNTIVKMQVFSDLGLGGRRKHETLETAYEY